MAASNGCTDVVLSSVKAKYKPGKGTGIDGVLLMKRGSFSWTPNDPRAAAKLNVDLSTLKSHRWSKETPSATSALLKFGTNPDPAVEGGYTFVFPSFKDRDRCRDIYAAYQTQVRPVGVSPAAQPSGVSSKPAHSGPPVRPGELQLDPAEMQRRQQLLQSDSHLRRLHHELVISGILKEEDFWATRKELLEGEASTKKRQRTGIASAMLADVRPVTDGRTNTVTFNLTPEIIAQIFAEKPAVLRAFLHCVPAKMKEKDFWTKYCRAEYQFTTKNSAAAAAEAADDEDLAIFVNEDTKLTEETRQKIHRVDPTVNMAADDADDYTTTGCHGILRDGGKEMHDSDANLRPTSRTIFKDINRHAAVVLQGRILDVENADARTVATALAAREASQEAIDPDEQRKREEKLKQATELNDLQEPTAPAVVPLCIQDPRKYFDVQSAATGEGRLLRGTSGRLKPREAAQAMRNQAAELVSMQTGNLIMLQDQATKVLKDLTHHMAAAKAMEGPTAEKSVLAPLPENIRSTIFAHAEGVKELLKHFWGTFPITNQMLLEKAERHKKGIDLLYDKLEVGPPSRPTACSKP